MAEYGASAGVVDWMALAEAVETKGLIMGDGSGSGSGTGGGGGGGGDEDGGRAGVETPTTFEAEKIGVDWVKSIGPVKLNPASAFPIAFAFDGKNAGLRARVQSVEIGYTSNTANLNCNRYQNWHPGRTRRSGLP